MVGQLRRVRVPRLRAEQLPRHRLQLAPHSAFLLAQGVETLPYRIQAHVDNARVVAEWLDDDPRIERVFWAGLPDHPHFERAAKYLPKGPGSVFSFEVKGGREVGQKLIESVNLASHLANIGDAKTLIIHPASTTHAAHRPAARRRGRAAGVVRLSVGIEDVEDIIADLDQALSAATTAWRWPARRSEETDEHAIDTATAVATRRRMPRPPTSRPSASSTASRATCPRAPRWRSC